jgi:Antirestriction protein (ArdA)
MRTIWKFEDVIDSREVIERIKELRGLLPETALEVMPGTSDELATIQNELSIFEKLAEQGENYAADWDDGVALIRDSYFTDYAQAFLEDCGDIPRNIPHYIAIDWEATARNIQVDYTPIDFDGVTYWVR